MKRNEIKSSHEKAVLDSFIDYCKLEGDICNIIDTEVLFPTPVILLIR